MCVIAVVGAAPCQCFWSTLRVEQIAGVMVGDLVTQELVNRRTSTGWDPHRIARA
jgi:hypothetical protein